MSRGVLFNKLIPERLRNTIKLRINFIFASLVLSLIVFIQICIFVFLDGYYYGGVAKLLKERASITAEFLNKYEEYSDIDKKSNFLFNTFLGEFDKKFLIQTLDKNGIVVMDSLKSTNLQKIEAEDVTMAFENKMVTVITKDELTGIRIMSVSKPLIRYSAIDGLVRYSVSLEKIDSVVARYYTMSVIVSIILIILMFRIIDSLSATIVFPIERLTEVARNMANGNMSVRAKKMIDDEIGELSDTLNFMASEIERNDQVKKDFVSSISHELRTPLTSIKGWGEILLVSEAKPNTSLETGLKIITSEADRLKDMVEELLDFAKLQDHKMKIIKRKISIRNILRSVYNQMKPRTEGIDFTVSYEGEDITIEADPNRIRQVLINLIMNSIKFAKENPRIAINLKSNENDVEISIEDNGIGISKENLKKVKEKFYKEDINSSGSGIGLAVVDEIVKAHNGNWFIESDKNEGTKIIISLPINSDTSDKE